MFLSRIELGPQAAQSRQFWREVSRPYRAHQALWRLLGDGSPDQRRGFLFRQEEVAGRPSFLVLSERRPAPDAEGLWGIETKEFRPNLRVGQRLVFKLRASPVVRRSEVTATGRRRSRRHDVVMDAKKHGAVEATTRHTSALIEGTGSAWLQAQAGRAGFRLCETGVDVVGPDGLLEIGSERGLALRVDGYRQHRFRRPREEAREALIRFSTVDFEGLLEVVDPEAFLTAVSRGFGPQKAFGCGLMLLRRG